MSEIMKPEEYMNEAFGEAFHGMRSNHGGPFGAVIVRNGEIIGRGCNRVILHSDPTAHAEIVAIRDACANIQSHDLSGCIIYTTCEPCPMCFSAIYWSNLTEVIFCLSRQDAEDLGFRDKHIYEEISRDFPDRNTKFTRMDHPMINPLIREWNGKPDRFLY